MSRREGKCYIWTKSDAVSVRRQTQLSCPKDNRLSGQHYTKLSEPGDPQGPEGAAEVGAQMHADSDSNSSLFLSLSPLWGRSVRKAGCPMVVSCLSAYHKDTLMTWGHPTVHTTQKTSCNGFDRKEFFQSMFMEWLDVKEPC